MDENFNSARAHEIELRGAFTQLFIQIESSVYSRDRYDVDRAKTLSVQNHQFYIKFYGKFLFVNYRGKRKYKVLISVVII